MTKDSEREEKKRSAKTDGEEICPTDTGLTRALLGSRAEGLAGRHWLVTKGPESVFKLPQHSF